MILGIKNKHLNNDVLKQIWSFISFKSNPHLLILNKYNYISNRPITKINNIDSYIRFLIRNDYNFLFSFLLLNTIIKKININKTYKYKKEKYKNYIHFLRGLCINYNSNKCKILLINFENNFNNYNNYNKGNNK